MHHTANRENLRFVFRSTTMLALSFALVLALAAHSASAQTLNVLYNFTGQQDGSNPAAGVTLDAGGNLYGTTAAGGSSNCSYSGVVGCGTVFKLSHRGSGWLFAPLHGFTGNPDGANPLARVVFGPGGVLFGTTAQGGSGYGTVFQLQPPARICPTPSCPWSETQLYSFAGNSSAANPGGGDLVFDAQGTVYGTAASGSGYLCDDGPCGAVYELMRSGGGWNEQEFNFFEGISNAPFAGLTADGSGNYYGVTSESPGGIFSFSNGVGTTLLTFSQQSEAVGGLVLDATGDLYGTTSQGGSAGGGTVFKYVPSTGTLTTIYNFNGPNNYGAGPTATLLMDAAGNLYGTTHTDGAYGQGSVFKLTQSNGNWTLTTLHDFTGLADGGQPFGQLTMDASGNIYGTTTVGGNIGHCYLGLGCGVIFEITSH